MKQKLLTKLLILLLCTLGGASSAWADTKELTFSLTSNPGGWPTSNSTTLTNYTYTLSEVNYTFGLKNVKCNSGYLMMTYTAVLGLPAIEGYKLTKVVAQNSSGCSTSTQVGISSSSSSASYITGGAYQTWSKTSSTYTYNLTSTSANTMYYLYVTNKNAQVTELKLTYEQLAVPITSIEFDKNEAEVEIGGTVSITPTISPTGYTETPVWESDHTDIATVSNGVVTGVAEGTALITLKSPTNASIYDVCEVTVNAPTIVATPSMSVAEGTYNVAQSVTLSCATDDATIRYTTDGTDPTSSSTVYGSAISVGQTMTIKAKAFKEGLTDSGIASATYTLKCVAPTFSPDASTVSYGSEITLSSTTGGSTIYYTTNGDTPTTSSTAYDSSNKPSINASQTIKAIAAKSGWSNSDVSSAVYIANYTITGVSNDEDKGTVTASTTTTSNTTITATPKSGYRVIAGDGGYSVTSGSATVVNNGDNTFTVTPTTDCTVQINFEAIPTHTVTFFVNGDVSRTATVAEGASITFPTAADTPSDASEFNKTLADGKTFMGWYTAEYSHATDAPASYVNTSTTTMSTSNVTYYAVYAEVEITEGSYTLDYNESNGTNAVSDLTLGYGNAVNYTAKDGSAWIIKAYKSSGMQINTGKNSSIKIPSCPGNIQSVKITCSAAKAVGVSSSDYSGSGTITYQAYGTDATSQTIDLSSKSIKTGYIVPKSGSTSITKIVVDYKDVDASNFTTDNRSAADIAFANAEVDVKLTSGYTGQALTNTNSVSPISYSSSDESVATINSSTGAITELLKAGSTTITATFAGNATFKPADVSYDLNVTEKTPHGLTYATSEVAKLTTDAAFTNTLTNGYSLSVSYTSSDADVATVSSTGEVTIKGAGSATITATFAGDDDYEAGSASYTLTVSKATPTLEFASDNATLREGEDFDGNALTNPANLTVTYSSSATSVATVNSSTGAPTFEAAGSTTITASFAGNDTYTSAYASYTLTVLAAPTITVSNQTIAWGETFTVDDSKITGGDITVTSGNTSIATVDGLEITPVACGEVTITVSTAENGTYKEGSATFTLTIEQPAGGETAKPGENILLFGESFGNNTGSARDWNDSYSVKSGVSTVYSGITGYTVSNARQGKNTTGSIQSGLNQSSSGTDAYIIIGPLNVAKYSDMTLTYQWNAGSTKGTYSTSAYYKTSAGGDFTEITGGTGAGATSFVERSYTVPAAAQVSTLYLKIVWNTSNTQAIIDEVQLKGSLPGTESVTLNASGYATFCSQYPLDFTGYATNGFSAWQITDIDKDSGDYTITFSEIKTTIKGGQGILLKGEASTTINIPSSNSTTELNDNLLEGTIAPQYVSEDTYYGLKGDNFVPVNAGTVKAGKALLPASALSSGSPVKGFTFVFEDEVDGICEMKNEKLKMNNDEAIYNLSGQRLNKMQRGINIINGRKVFK